VPPYEPPLLANWTGFYLGLNAGYGFGKSDWDFPAVSPSPTGVLAGGTIGYNFQVGLWVWGIEGDFDYFGMKGSTDCFVGDSCESKATWIATGRARLGYAGWNKWLPYITGGAAGAALKASASVGDATKIQIGWTAGAGVEYAMLPHWSVKVEYLYMDLGSFDCGATCSVPGADSNVSFKTNAVRAGVNYRL
jgi:outer membrane immunogenic protein